MEEEWRILSEWHDPSRSRCVKEILLYACLDDEFIGIDVSDCWRSRVGVVCESCCHCLRVVRASTQHQPQHSAEANQSSHTRHSDPTRCCWYMRLSMLVSRLNVLQLTENTSHVYNERRKKFFRCDLHCGRSCWSAVWKQNSNKFGFI